MWDQTLAVLKLQMIKSQFHSLRASSATKNGDELTVFLHDEMAMQWAERLRRPIENGVHQIYGDETTVTFSVRDDEPEPDKPPSIDDEFDNDDDDEYDDALDARPIFADFRRPTYTAENGEIIYTRWRTSGGQVNQDKQMIAPFIARITEKLIIHDDYEQRVVYTIAGQKGAKQFSAHVDADDWADTRKFVSVMLRYLPGKPPAVDTSLRRHWATAISHLTEEDEMTEMHAMNSTGWTPDGKAFLMPGGSIGKNYVCRLERGLDIELKRFGLTRITRSDERRVAAAMLALTGVYRPDVIYTLLAHTFLPPLIRWVGDDARYLYHIHADTGNLKTELAKLMLAFYGPTGPAAITYKWTNTPFGAESRAHALKDCLMLIDDLKPNTINQDDQARWVAFVQAAVDALGRKRATIGGGAAKSLPPRALLLSTGEAVPEAGEASYTARMLLAELNTQPPGRNHLLDHIKTVAPLFRGLMYQYILWLKKRNGAGAAAEYKRIQADGIETAHARLANNYASNRLGAVMLSKFLVERGLISPARREHFLDLHRLGLVQIVAYTSQRAHEERYSQRFIEALRDAIGAGFAVVSNEPAQNRVGWQDNTYLYLLSGTLEIVNQWLRASGQTPINITKNDLRRQLFSDGMTHSTASRQKRRLFDHQATDPAAARKLMVIAVYLEKFNE